MKLQNLIEYLSITQMCNLKDRELSTIEIKSISQDTRKLENGGLFVCIKGATFDGHRFVKQAEQAGVAVIVAQDPIDVEIPVIYVPNTQKAMAQLANKFYNNPTHRLKMFGVTGTNGKTTITHLIDAILMDQLIKTGLIGTMYNKIDQEVIPTINTTPDSITLQKLLDEMLKKGITHCAMEVSSHALILGRTWGIDFDVAIFTNLTQDHLDFHETMEKYFIAKSLLFSQLGNAYSGKKKTAVINIDDDYGRKLIPMTAANVYTYGCHGEGTIQAKNIKVTSEGTKFNLLCQNSEYPVTLKLVGDFNVYNVLAAFGACFAMGISAKEIISSLEKINGVKGRFELVPNLQDITAIVDFAHTPDGLQNVLRTARKMLTANAIGKLICVIGCGGDRDKAKRPIMGEIAVKYSDHVIFTSDNPRTEDPEQILDQIIAPVKTADNFETIVDRKAAIIAALSQAEPNDLVLVAGKGHEQYQIIGNVKHHFDDTQVIADYFNEK